MEDRGSQTRTLRSAFLVTMDQKCTPLTMLTMDQKSVCTRILHHINALRLRDSFCDATLFVDGHTFPVHKTILVATSAFFSALMSEQDHVIYQVNGIKSEDFVHVLDFLYTGQIQLDANNVLLYKNIAEQLQIGTMLQVCESYEKESLQRPVTLTGRERISSYINNKQNGNTTTTNGGTSTTTDDFLTENRDKPPADQGVYQALEVSDSRETTPEQAENIARTEMAADGLATEDMTNLEPMDLIESNNDAGEDEEIPVAMTTRDESEGAEAAAGPSVTSPKEEGGNDVTMKGSLSDVTVKDSPNDVTVKGPLTCEWCGILYRSLSTLRNHCKDAHLNKMYKCTFCPRRFVQTRQLERHIDHCRLARTEDGRISCPQCDYTSKKQNLVVQHYRKEHTNKLHSVCKLCGVAFNGKLLYYEHLLQKHDAKVEDIKCKVHSCDICSFKTVKLHAFKVHKQGHREGQFTCDVCQLVCNSEGTLNKHKKNIHENNILYKCTICNYTSKYKATLMSHAYRVHKVISTKKQKVYYCPYCDFSHIEHAILRKHERQCHSDEKQFQCKVCCKKFRHKAQLTIHERVHSGVRPFPCELCEYKAQSKPALIVHKRHSHSNEKNYICEFCGFATKGPSNLLSHKKRCKSNPVGTHAPAPAHTVCVIETSGVVYTASDLDTNDLEAVSEIFQ